MSIFECPGCGKKLRVSAQAAGKRVKCPNCSKIVPVPAAIVSTPAPAGLPTDAATVAPRAPAFSEPTRSLSPGEGSPGDSTAPGSGGADLDIRQLLAPAEAHDEIGRLGPYRVLKVLGRGGMGVVLLAHDTQLERRVALKMMLPGLADEAGRGRFLREARAVAAIEHDHIVPIFHVGEATVAGVGVLPYFIMPFLQGEPLDARLRREKRLPVSEVLRIGRELALGLSAAHRRGLIHRDIKPANVWLEADTDRVKILDFGLARAARDRRTESAAKSIPSGAAELTQQGAIVGTPAYMAPEQVNGHRVDHRCDLFGLGCVLYAISTGELPFQGDDTLAVLAAVVSDHPRPPHKRRPNVPIGLSNLIVSLLAKAPADRPPSAEDVADELGELRRAQRPRIGFSVTSLVLGLSSLATIPCSCAGLPVLLGPMAIVFGLIGKKKGGRGMAITGIVTGSIGLMVSLIIIGVYVFFMMTVARSQPPQVPVPSYSAPLPRGPQGGTLSAEASRVVSAASIVLALTQAHGQPWHALPSVAAAHNRIEPPGKVPPPP
jgi:serine/threonine protein kinase